ncbi:MAG TPA: NAD-dependent epimerase/dehydratase family protein [Planctomycetota bacterium]|jgi:nucleoside-diphosphate-sugar epimerase
MKVLVTGGGGFLGRAIVEMLLSRGDRVRILARSRYPDIAKLGAESVMGDIRDVDSCVQACMGQDIVFHTAALPGIWGNIQTFESINVQGTRNIIAACKRRGVPKLIYTSSPSVVFDMKDECGIDESAPYPERFFNPYSETKARAEQEVLKASGQDGLLTCSLRPHLLWGPRDNHLIPRLIDRARKRKLRIVGKGQNSVDLTYVENAAMAHLLAGDAIRTGRAAGQAYFISDGRPVVLWEWINNLLKRLSIAPATKHVSTRVAYAGGYLLESWYAWRKRYDEPQMTRFLARALSCSHYYNIEKARRDFGYRPVVNAETGMQRTLEYFRNYGIGTW